MLAAELTQGLALKFANSFLQRKRRTVGTRPRKNSTPAAGEKKIKMRKKGGAFYGYTSVLQLERDEVDARPTAPAGPSETDALRATKAGRVGRACWRAR